MITCISCGDAGYVTDGAGFVNAPAGGPITIYVKCPHCEKQIEIKQCQASYVQVKPLIEESYG